MRDMVFSLLKKIPPIDSLDYVEWAYKIHCHMVMVHPFRDGNGRTSRLLMNTLLLRGRWPVVIIPPNLKTIYNRSIHMYESGNQGQMWRFIMEMMFRSFTNAYLIE